MTNRYIYLWTEHFFHAKLQRHIFYIITAVQENMHMQMGKLREALFLLKPVYRAAAAAAAIHRLRLSQKLTLAYLCVHCLSVAGNHTVKPHGENPSRPSLSPLVFPLPDSQKEPVQRWALVKTVRGKGMRELCKSFSRSLSLLLHNNWGQT